MEVLFETLSRRLREMWRPTRSPRASRAFRCRCGRPVFFRNSECLACHTPLGYLPDRLTLVPLQPAGDDRWRVWGEDDGPLLKRCRNFDAAACNWLLAADDAATLCVSCRLNHLIPDLSVEENRVAWQRIENAKRRLVSQLLALGLPVVSRVEGAGGEDTERGLAFDFLRPMPGQPTITGHASGIVTLNIEEADDATRERIRTELREPYRTLLGHLRHEVGHYYWERLVAHTPWLDRFREVFGDERADYGEALKRHYEQGPPRDWAQRHVSAYAASHPWEDWAETWAHYLHMVDTVETAMSFGLDAEDLEVDTEPFGVEVLEGHGGDPGAADFLVFVNAWVEITALLNEMSRSMGQHDFYPFVLSRAAVRKLHFVHEVVTGARAADAPKPAAFSGSAGTAASVPSA
jgi:hypothetical protein